MSKRKQTTDQQERVYVDLQQIARKLSGVHGELVMGFVPDSRFRDHYLRDVHRISVMAEDIATMLARGDAA